MRSVWVFIGRADTKAETPIIWPPDAKRWLIGKDPDAGKDWGQEEKGATEDEMAGWHHGLDGHEFGWTPGVGDGQGGLACYGSWDCKELDTTERLNWLNWTDAIQPSHPWYPSSSPALSVSHHQGLFQWAGSLHLVAKVLELQLQHQSFQWVFRVEFL